VDITNYVMFETGQPLHAFDYDVLVKRAGGKPPTIITRLPFPNETLTTLDGVERALGAEQILVCDTQGALSLGGIMGGGESEISDATTTVLLEAAAWNFINIRKTAQAQKLFSEAGTRFSRGVHPAQAEIGLRRAIDLMREVAGGKIAKGIADAYPQPAPVIKIELPEREIERLTGMAVPIAQAGDILSRLGFEVTLRAESLVATVPDHRMDISDDEVIGQADLIEEIARVIGLDNLPVTLLDETLPAQWSNTALEREEQAKDVLVSLGLTENITHRFVTPEQEALFIPKGSSGVVGVNPPANASHVLIANPIQPDKTALRQSLLTNLLASARANLRHTERVAAFEVGVAFYRIAGQQLPEELPRLAVVMAGPRQPAHWAQADSAPLDFYDLKGVVEGLLDGLHIGGTTLSAGGAAWLHPGRSASLALGGQHLGSFGELHPLVARAFDLPADSVFLVAEFDAARLLGAVNPLYRTQPVLHTPVVKEDLAFVVKDEVQAGALQSALEGAGAQFLRSVSLFDVYQGGSVPAGHKSLAYSVVYQADDHTLTEAEIAAARKKLIKAAQKAVGAELRG
jgi:phenylalanyl-tRNA synthetase beta chain